MSGSNAMHTAPLSQRQKYIHTSNSKHSWALSYLSAISKISSFDREVVHLWARLLVFNMKVALSCPTLCNPLDCTVQEILQARILEWVAFPFSRGSSQPRDQPGSPTCRWILYQLSHQGNPRILEWVAYPFSSRSSWPRNRTRISCIAGGFFTNWAIREAVNSNGEKEQ